MWLDDLGEELTEIDRELMAFIRAVDSRKQAIIDDTLNKEAKYSIGYEFNHPQYWKAKVVNIVFTANKQETLDSDYSKSIYDDPYVFWPDVKSFYKPYFMYECEVYIEGKDKPVITTVTEDLIDLSNTTEIIK